MNNYLRRFLAVMCFVAMAAISCPLAAPQVAQPASTGVAVGSANAPDAGRWTVVAYSADRITVTTQTLADGTTITHRSLTKVYRDSRGRRRDEYFGTQGESSGEDGSPTSISINDPVAGVYYYLNPRDRTAQRHEFRKPTPSTSPSPAAASANPAPARPALPQPTREDLGTQVIEGLEAKGVRVTRTVPEGNEGNDRPIKITTETWSSVNGQIMLLKISNDPRRGETVTRLTNIVLDDPPAELFQVPADYTVQELQPVSKPEPPSE